MIMKNKGIIFFLIILAIVILVVVVLDFNASKSDKLPPNPYEFNVDQFTKVDTALIMYKESRDLALSFSDPAGVCFKDDKLFVVGDMKMQIIGMNGTLLKEVGFDQKPTCVFVSSEKIFVGFRKSLEVLDFNYSKIADWNAFSDSTVITSIAEKSGTLFVADAGKRVIRRFSSDGKQQGTIVGKSGNEQIHGFIIPSPYFDLAFNPDGELWVVNPGKHSLENYTEEGNLRTWWQASSITTEGFSGCCNPAHFAFLPDGSFVTSEKGLVRIKIYKPSGEFSCVVAAPSKFTENGHAPDLAVDNQGTIYALDSDKKMLRLFIKK
jgi:hypothetical protein